LSEAAVANCGPDVPAHALHTRGRFVRGVSEMPRSWCENLSPYASGSPPRREVTGNLTLRRDGICGSVANVTAGMFLADEFTTCVAMERTVRVDLFFREEQG
jgi:hypothetical protein